MILWGVYDFVMMFLGWFWGVFKMFLGDIVYKEVRKNEDNVLIRTKESLHYYELYKENFKIPESDPEKNICSDCKFELVINSNFCRMCGKFPLWNYFLYFFGFLMKILLHPLQQK